MRKILKKGKKGQSGDGSGRDVVGSEVIDFDKINNSLTPEDKVYEMHLEEDIVNLGYWLMVFHPNFFEGSTKAKGRFVYWVIAVILLIFMQVWTIVRYAQVAIDGFHGAR